MSRFGGAASFLLLSIVFHAAYLGSIFDIYFVSPVISVGTRYGVGDNLENGSPGAEVGQRLAKRVVLIVGDGLRADKLFQHYPDPPFVESDPLPWPMPDTPHHRLSATTTTPAPYIRGLIESGQAQWGISHTRVPTESRPGHVAIIGGMYEDVSAVTRGWQTNPIPFDSVFNQSLHTFSFGSPDILPMFKQGASDPDKVDAWSYADEEEDFSKDAVELDLWVLEQLKILLNNATVDSNVDKQLRQEGTVIFLHLLGLDTTGHSYRPHGPEYHRNIRVVDWVVQQSVQLLEQFYEDKDTAFIFTADHGMSNKGNHGDGEPDNTRTPLVVWGAGVNTSKYSHAFGTDEYSKQWALKGRKDVNQADIAVLMSLLAGLPIPANSAGFAPLSYLDASALFKSKALLANVKQILEEFIIRRNNKAATALFFKEYHALTLQKVTERLAFIQMCIYNEEHQKAQDASLLLANVAAQGLRYYLTYDWLILRTIVTLGYLGFMAYSIHFILHSFIYPGRVGVGSKSPSLAIPAFGIATFIGISIKFFVEKAPFTYYLYLGFPCLFWTTVLRDPWAFRLLLKQIVTEVTPLAIFGFILTIGSVQLMVSGYQNRSVFSILILLMGILWPQYSFTSVNVVEASGGLRTAWRSHCVVLAVFPILPVEKRENLLLILSGGFTMLSLVWLAHSHLNESLTFARWSTTIRAQMCGTVLSMVVAYWSASSLQAKKGVPAPSYYLGWLLMAGTFVIPYFHGRPRGQPAEERLILLISACSPTFTILSLSYEGLFFAVFSSTLLMWITLEVWQTKYNKATTNIKIPTITIDVLRISLFFLIFFHVGFFGVGNVASISTFYLEPVLRLIPVFAPFPMAALLIFKILIPFAVLAVSANILNQRLGLPPFMIFIVTSVIAELMTLNFFWLVKDYGSWLEIGSTITNFAICSLLTIFNAGLFLWGEFILANSST